MVRTSKLDVRLTETAKATISAAAAVERRSMSEFVVESALLRAEAMLADRQRFSLTAEQWEVFLTALDAPPRELPNVRRLLSEPSIFSAPAPK
jgi:uncharacterized protein (DUF1778 family)